ncbi:hypothetical protein ON010_g18200 [Phytophthora cinnamomi]|nr:hypothetical protein ON010_g18200 [Phytophthora cinnamomi]
MTDSCPEKMVVKHFTLNVIFAGKKPRGPPRRSRNAVGPAPAQPPARLRTGRRPGTSLRGPDARLRRTGVEGSACAPSRDCGDLKHRPRPGSRPAKSPPVRPRASLSPATLGPQNESFDRRSGKSSREECFPKTARTTLVFGSKRSKSTMDTNLRIHEDEVLDVDGPDDVIHGHAVDEYARKPTCKNTVNKHAIQHRGNRSHEDLVGGGHDAPGSFVSERHGTANDTAFVLVNHLLLLGQQHYTPPPTPAEHVEARTAGEVGRDDGGQHVHGYVPQQQRREQQVSIPAQRDHLLGGLAVHPLLLRGVLVLARSHDDLQADEVQRHEAEPQSSEHGGQRQ